MNNRKITIFITVYNIEEHLDRFFDCLKKQTYTDYEALIIDDGSEDGSLAVCQRYAASDDRIRVMSVKHIGISAARNLAFSQIRTPYAASLDGDDYFDEDYLRHLMDAEEKYHADMVMSNVIYVTEDGAEKERFCPRAEGFYTRKDFSDLLPALLEENRLNFLYAKLFRTEILRQIRVEPDVRQGSDTMINTMFLTRANSIAVIGDYDYCYVQYQKRSVTSYRGADFFNRLYRINRFVMDCVSENGLMNAEMERVLDGRILFSGRSYLTRIAFSDTARREKYRLASEVINSPEYLVSYKRMEENNTLGSYRDRYQHDAVVPGEEREYVDKALRIRREEEKNRRIGKLREICPDFLFRIWHSIRVKLGTARKV